MMELDALLQDISIWRAEQTEIGEPTIPKKILIHPTILEAIRTDERIDQYSTGQEEDNSFVMFGARVVPTIDVLKWEIE
ncbi:hypothetical protein ERJ70_05245 [Sediminibacillus dalangtanensis]|uniref:Uncharacterized protein n=1 Tax=Sediminibacillus dalangtanensis TaxID=2729421 RepID=A0ABX7VPD9_9BACI|nr:hypothetical protein [Sediminibacillus dalangtanensis]QTM98751.1 hypothetical protein ERJ70_05245 [Sediminibacillus dalangtanensis]